MSHEQFKGKEHAYTAIEIAMNDVQRSFSIGEYGYTWDMLLKAATISGKSEIWEELDKYVEEVDNERHKIQMNEGTTYAETAIRNQISEQEYLRHQCFIFLRKLVVQLTKHKIWYSDHGPPTRATGLKQLADKLEYDRH